MQQQLINHSPDLKRLRDEGYEIETKDGYLIVHNIPYVNKEKEVKLGKIIIQLTIIGGIVKYSGNHVINFMGEYPCNKDGSNIESIRHMNLNKTLDKNIVMNYSFSNKPLGGYKNHYQQITRYINIISSPAIAINPSVSPKTFKVRDENLEDNIFNYIDTNESRSNIVDLNNKFKGQKIAIIGLGGTGAYILDLVAKTPVTEIHLFDKDIFSQHNAFRCPGAASKSEIDANMSKVEYLKNIYSKMHKGIINHCEYISSENFSNLNNMSYIFICIDNSKIKERLIQYLVKNNKTFFDVGLGTNIVNNSLYGSIRVTTGSPIKYDHLKKIPIDDEQENEYSTNIQIADLNNLNAILAVIKWKKICGFYQDLEHEFHTVYTINDSEIINEDKLSNS